MLAFTLLFYWSSSVLNSFLTLFVTFWLDLSFFQVFQMFRQTSEAPDEGSDQANCYKEGEKRTEKEQYKTIKIVDLKLALYYSVKTTTLHIYATHICYLNENEVD